MGLFRNMFFIFLLIGVVTRVELFYVRKWTLKMKVSPQGIVYGIFILNLIVIMPLSAINFGFDVAFFVYGISLLVWLMFDLMRQEQKKGNSE